MKPCQKNKIAAFTLLELSIVLVIIGLLIGGIIVGQSLIHQSHIRAQLSDIERINTSVNAFKLKYHCLPGDCLLASDFFDGTTQPEEVTDGNGNGIIRGYSSDSTPTINTLWCALSSNVICEYMSVFDHLSAAGLWPMPQYDESDTAALYPGIGLPAIRLPVRGVVYPHANFQPNILGGVAVGYEPAFLYNTGGHRIRLGACAYATGTWGPGYVSFHCSITPSESFTIDSKIDDGKPMSGNMVLTEQLYVYNLVGSGVNSPHYCRLGNSNDSAVTDANNVYRNDSNMLTIAGSVVGRHCPISIKAAF